MAMVEVVNNFKVRVKEQALGGIARTAAGVLPRLPVRTWESLMERANNLACQRIERQHQGTSEELRQKIIFVDTLLHMAKKALPNLSPNCRK